MGHRARQPRLVADGHARAKWLEVTRLEPQPRQDPRCAEVRFELKYFDASGKKLERTERLEIPGAVFRKEGLGKDVTDKFLAGVPGIQKEGCDGLITVARWIVHKMPAHVRTVCLEFFGNAKDAVPSIVEIRTTCSTSRRSRRRASASCSPASSTSTTATSRRWATRPRASGRGGCCRRWCCSATSSATTPTRSRGRPARSSASPTRAPAKASSPSAPRRARSSGSTASAPRRSASTPTPSRSTRTS